MTSTLETRARTFAEAAHAGQVRKYTGEAYVTHCEAVAALVRSVPHTEEMLAAALLHDTVEDCGVTHDTILAEFGPVVSYLVLCLTDVSKPEYGNRAFRKAMDRQHLSYASPEAKTVKLADLVDNARSIMAHDPSFAKVFLAEKEALLAVLTEGDATLLALAHEVLAQGKTSLREAQAGRN